MTQAASQAAAFYREVAKSRVLWSICDDMGYPQPKNPSGDRAQPFWSSEARVTKIITTVPAYSTFMPERHTWEEFVSSWIPDLEEHKVLVGVNWSGPKALGYDIEPRQMQQNVEYAIASMSRDE